jgi:hypothetical protein
MKRISLLASVVCLFMAMNAQAWYGNYTPLRYRVHYSPYAFGYHHSGLVPGCTRYNMVAMDRHHSGLVSEWVRYSPYAFGLGHNGLIHDYAGCGSTDVVAYDLERSPRIHTGAKTCANGNGGVAAGIRSYASREVSWRSPSGQVTRVIDGDRPSRLDQRTVIEATLKEHYPGNFQYTRPFKINREYATFDILIDDGRTLVKYWNPGMIAELRAEGGTMGKRFENYLETWAKACNEHEDAGGKVVHIASNDADQVVRSLCQVIDAIDATETMVCKTLPANGN